MRRYDVSMASKGEEKVRKAALADTGGELESVERDAQRFFNRELSWLEFDGRVLALAEDRLVLYGDPVGAGFLTSPKSPHIQIGDWKQTHQLIADLVQAVETLDASAIPGPYEAVLSSSRYYTYMQATTEAGYPASRTVEKVLKAVHRSPVMRDGGAVFSMRGGDFVITVGGDLAPGYRWHDRESVHLFCAETLAPQMITPEAVCLLS